MEYIVYSPGGNETALVVGTEFDKKAVNDKLLREHPGLEQVGFLSPDAPKLEMAGGEFCGNATRCAAHYYLRGKPGRIEIEICGMMIPCGIYENGEVWAELPKASPRKICDGVYLVEMEGITHIVVKKDEVQTAALGVIFADGDGINPYVWVRGVDTVFNETACLSGTVAFASVLGENAEVRQPSGSVFDVTCADSIKVSGAVREIGRSISLD